MENNAELPLVLIVDDQPEVLRIYARGLEVGGYRVQTADSVDTAMRMLLVEPPDAILVDLKMPYINGMGMLYRIRKAHPRMPVAIMTGMQNLDKDTLQEVAMLDAVVHYKPMTIIQIREIVDNLLTKKS